LKFVQEVYGVKERNRRGRAAASPYLFTGLLECSECGGSITIVSERCRKRFDSRYGCSMHAQRVDAVCKNALLVRRLELERQLLEGLQTRVLHPAVVDYTLKRFEDELLQAVAERSQGDADLRRQASALERGIANQLRGLSDGYSESITTEIARLEGQLAAIRERLKTSDAVTVKLQMRDTRRFVETASESERIMGRRAADRPRGNRAPRWSSDARRIWKADLLLNFSPVAGNRCFLSSTMSRNGKEKEKDNAPFEAQAEEREMPQIR
jgi:hypothetical protein